MNLLKKVIKKIYKGIKEIIIIVIEVNIGFIAIFAECNTIAMYKIYKRIWSRCRKSKYKYMVPTDIINMTIKYDFKTKKDYL